MNTKLNFNDNSGNSFSWLLASWAGTLPCLVAGLLMNLLTAEVANAQGWVKFSNSDSGERTRVFAPCPTNLTLSVVGNGTADIPPGTVDWSGFTRIGAGGVAGQYGAAGTFAQLFSANGADQPEFLLVPSSPTTTFRTAGGGGLLAPIFLCTLSNVPPEAPAATIQMVAWDNSSGNYPTWVEAFPAWQSGLIAAGKGVVINVTNVGGPITPPPALLGLQSFNLFFASPPTVVCQPAGQTAEQGATVTWSARASGCRPLGYQWFLNGTNVPCDPASDHLILTDVQFSQSGACLVVVTNLFGAATSSPAMLSVMPPLERRSVPGVKLMGEAGSLFNVVYADALSATPAWLPLDTVSLGSTSQYCFDLTMPLQPERYYRAWQTATQGMNLSLELQPVPAIAVTGDIGNSVRVDAINRYGATDAWFTLDTVTLTNTSQLYFDTSAWRQPERLYRLVPSP